MANSPTVNAETYFQAHAVVDQTVFSSIQEMIGWRFYTITKRLMDLCGASLAILIFSPIMIVTAFAIKLDSPGPIFFMPTRVGRSGKLFKMLKFRSMRMYQIDGEVVHAHEILKKDEHLLTEYKKNSYKLKNDPRVTHVGKFIRKYSID